MQPSTGIFIQKSEQDLLKQKKMKAKWPLIMAFYCMQSAIQYYYVADHIRGIGHQSSGSKMDCQSMGPRFNPPYKMDRIGYSIHPTHVQAIVKIERHTLDCRQQNCAGGHQSRKFLLLPERRWCTPFPPKNNPIKSKNQLTLMGYTGAYDRQLFYGVP